MPLSAFHPTLAQWFASRLGEPTPPQRAGWPLIRDGKNVLIAAPTGSGKTLAAFLSAIDALLHEGQDLPDETRVLYVSPLRALSNDIQKNLQQPLSELRDLNIFLPEIRVLVRTGDTPAAERAAMGRKPPHILVTTPESLYILLTSDSGRRMLRTVRTVIIDEIHALARDKRGSHLALSLERLESLTASRSVSDRVPPPPGTLQRIGLSATQKPIESIAHFLVGVNRPCEIVDVGHRREMDLAVEIPKSPLTAVCAHETWSEIYERVSQLIREHRTTLVFVNTRKLAERIAARLTTVLGPEEVTCHHSSLSKARRLDAEQRLKAGKLRALVATASLELGIDIGEIDLAIQIGAPRSISTFLQRVGRAGHTLQRIPKGRLFPLTLDELVEAAALMRAIRRGELDHTPQPLAPLDILAQQTVAACVPEPWDETALLESYKRAWPYRDLSRETFDAAVNLHTQGRHGLLHRDGVGGRLLAKRRARITAMTCGGAIPDVADYRVLMEPEGTFVGTLNEDFAVESNTGDIFQLGNTSWRILKIEPGVVRVADAKGQPPNVPFWLGESLSRTAELSAEIATLREDVLVQPSHAPALPSRDREGAVRDHSSDSPPLPRGRGSETQWLMHECGLTDPAAQQIADYIAEGRRILGSVPTQKRIIIERFFDESGGMQMVVHAPFGGRINRAWGLALRKRFCRGFGFELQAAANEEAIVISLGMQHSFPLESVFDFLHPDSCRDVLIQALLDQPMFQSRWRWNLTRSLVMERMQSGKRVPAPILRMRAEDLLVQAFPQVVACPENLPGGDLPIPDHPLVQQTIHDCLTEAMDADGFVQLIRDIREGRIERIAIDTPEPSAFARGILNANPYAFLDDAPLEERRTQAVLTRRTLDPRTADDLGALDPAAVERVREEAWPRPESAEEVHEALLWMGYVTLEEARPWRMWITELAAAKRVVLDEGRWFAAEIGRDPKELLRGRMDALGPVFSDDPALLELETEGKLLRTRLDGKPAWCERRLLARIHRYTLDRLRSEIEPVTTSQFLDFLDCWQHVDDEYRLEGPRGVTEVVKQMAGFPFPAAEWESHVLSAAVRDYRREWLDELTLFGDAVWGRLWGSGASPIRTTPICVLPREDLDAWLTLAEPLALTNLCGSAHDIHTAITARGAMFPQEIQRAAGLVPAHLEMGLTELIGFGALTCDSFAGLRQLVVPPSRRRQNIKPPGRWSLFRASPPYKGGAGGVPSVDPQRAGSSEFVAKQLLRRTGVVFRRTLLRERQPIPWYELLRALRRMELRGEVRGGRFVAGFAGEQYALPEAVELLRKIRKRPRPVRPPVATDLLALRPAFAMQSALAHSA